MANDSEIPSSGLLTTEASAVASPLYMVTTSARVHPVVTDLEPWIVAGIGKIVALWAHEEWLLTGIAARYMGYDRKVSRARLSGRADAAIGELLCGFALAQQVAPEILARVISQTLELAELRNAVAHGVWLQDQNTGQVTLQRVSGAWEIHGMAAGDKSALTESLAVSPELFEAQAAKLTTCIADTERLRLEVEALGR
jgi:hypothetical protein